MSLIHMRYFVAVAAALVAAPALAQSPSTPPPGQTPATKNGKPDVDPWAGRTDLFVPPTLKPSTQVVLGAVQRSTLANGIQTIVVPRRTVPSVSVALAVPIDQLAEPVDKSGLTDFMAEMLHKGTKKRTADQISQAVDFVGASLNAGKSHHGVVVTCHARTRDLQLCLDLVADVAMNPIFPESEMAEVKDQLVAGVEQGKDNAQRLAGLHAANVFFGDEDPRGIPHTKRSISAIDRAALLAFHEKWFGPDHALLTISGDVDGKSTKGLIDKAFAGWKKKGIPAPTEHPAQPLPKAPKGGLPVRLVDKSDATQATIVVLGPGIKHADPDFYAVQLLNYTLGGGGFSSRLMKVVRSEGGKTYGANSHFSAGLDAGPFQASTFTRTSETTATLKLVLDEIAKMRDKGPTEAELNAAKGNLIGGYGLHLETGDDLAEALAAAQLDGLDAGYVEKYPERLEAVTVADAVKAAASHLSPAALVVVGKASETGPLLKKAGYTKFEVVNYLDPVSGAERKRLIAERSANAVVMPAEAEAGKALLQQALAAKGGPALSKIENIFITAHGTATRQGQTTELTIEEHTIPNKAQRQDIIMPGATIIVSFADGKGFAKQGQEIQEMPAEQAKKAIKGLWRDPNFILLNASQPGARVRGLQPVQDGGVSYDALEIISPDGESTRLLLDKKTHLIAKLIFSEEGTEVREQFSDYRPEGGVAIAHKVVQEGGSRKIEFIMEKVKFNEKLPKDFFKSF